MKLFSKIAGIVAIVFMVTGVVGCATVGQPIITQMSEGQYQITLEGGPITSKATLSEEWNKIAAQKCNKFEIISQQFTEGYSGQTVMGVIKCKK